MAHIPALGIDIWEDIAYNVLTDGKQFSDRLTGLTNLCLICPQIYDSIRFDNNSRLYARLFRFKFDYTAPARRLSIRWRNTRCLALEFKKRSKILKRIRRREEFDVDDLWTAYLMMLENDGRNERHLVETALLYQYIHKFTISRFQAPRDDPSSWFVNDEITSLTLWLWWMIFFPAALGRESTSSRDALLSSLLPEFMWGGHLHHSIYAPDAAFELPLPHDLEHAPVSCSGPPPTVKKLTHYGNPLVLAAPSLTNAALLVWIVRFQWYLDAEPFDPSSTRLPPDRATANALGLRGPTIEDLRELWSVRIQPPERCTPAITYGPHDCFDDPPEEDDDDDIASSSLKGSRRYDSDWYRLVSCHDPWDSCPSLRGTVYRLGSLSGSWAGRFLQTDHNVHMNILRNPQLYEDRPVQLYPHPVFFELREHHCLYPNEPVSPGRDNFDGNDLLNAWIPRHSRIKHLNDAIEIYDPTTQSSTRYETYQPDGPGGPSYSAQVAEKLRKGGICGEWIEDEQTPTPLDNTDDDEFVDVACHRQSGVRDILLTGQTGEKHGAAWGHFNIIGRVRPWDGLVVLLRTPRDPEQAHFGRWIFRGYLHDQNFVGRWRETATTPDVDGYEGGFIVTKTS